jgi:aconitate decarboxylase
MANDGLTAGLARLAARSTPKPVGSDSLAAATRAFIDTIGVALAGWREPAVALLAETMAEGSEARAWSGERSLSSRDAAMLNGMAGHVLDYDDVAVHGHPSVVLVPAIVAEAQRLGLSGRAALEAYVLGYEAWAEFGAREKGAYHLGSWHPTAMLGTIAATVAVSALNRLDETRSGHAIALAASMASGLIGNFGTSAKPLQVGRAAANAIEAVQLASAGLTGSDQALEGPHGLLQGISPGGDVDRTSPPRFGEWRVLTEGLSVKRYPVCYASHRAIDAVIDLAAGLDPTAVAQVSVTLGPAPAATLRFAHPADGREARFSLHHNVAAALTDGAVGFAQLEDDYVRRPDIAALYGLSQVELTDEECPEQPGMAKYDRVVITTCDGRRLDSGPMRHPRGHARAPLSDDELDEKFIDCARHGGFNGAMLLDRLRSLDRLNDLGEVAA